MDDSTWYPPGFPRPKIPKWDDLLEDGITTFHIGQYYNERPAKAVACAICGSQQFNVGCDEYFTAIKCPHCGWEYCIHSG